jgi:hypothetical protein
MSNYKIHRWDVVMSGSSNVQAPMIYLEPDTTFMQFARENNFAVVCTISGTGTVYDGKQIPGVVSQSADVPSCRPNFYAKTGLYVVRLWANWYGYPHPDNLGMVAFSGLKGGTGTGHEGDTPEDQGKDFQGVGILRRHDLVRDHKHASPDPGSKKKEKPKVVVAPSNLSMSKNKKWETWLIAAGVTLAAALLIGGVLYLIRKQTSHISNHNLLDKNVAGD